ncbi:hypothetical protein [Streptomyces sp. NPDC093269]|uniref:hypothetical protein n=1 Tax=Streptomyces sp. NPDC093269 TaxID=3366038 RepID=UPI0038230F6F
MAGIRPLNAAVKAEVTADYNGLPHARITDTDGEAHVFTAGLPELELWFMALGGRITRQPAPKDSGVVLWTLHTDTDHGHGAPVHVHALAMDTDQPDADIADAVA